MKFDKLAKRFEESYRKEKESEAEELYNAFAEALAEHKVHVQVALYVLEMLRFSLLEEKAKFLFKRTEDGVEENSS